MILLNNFMRRETLGGRCLRRRGSRSREKLNAVPVLFPYREGVSIFDDAPAGLREGRSSAGSSPNDSGGVAWKGLTI
jgi:hypothetical protein